MTVPTVPKRAEQNTAQCTVTVPCAFKGTVHSGLCSCAAATDPHRAERHGQKQPTPAWLAEKVTQSRRAARPRTCRCGAPTLVGPDHDTCAANARVDLKPVDPIREVVAVLGGRLSYDLIGADLHIRWPEHIRAARPGHPIHLEHRCEETRLF